MNNAPCYFGYHIVYFYLNFGFWFCCPEAIFFSIIYLEVLYYAHYHPFTFYPGLVEQPHAINYPKNLQRVWKGGKKQGSHEAIL